MKQRGKAQPGDKTVVDASNQQQVQQQITLPYKSITVVSAAEAGMEETKTMIAHFGERNRL